MSTAASPSTHGCDGGILPGRLPVVEARQRGSSVSRKCSIEQVGRGLINVQMNGSLSFSFSFSSSFLSSSI